MCSQIFGIAGRGTSCACDLSPAQRSDCSSIALGTILSRNVGTVPLVLWLLHQPGPRLSGLLPSQFSNFQNSDGRASDVLPLTRYTHAFTLLDFGATSVPWPKVTHPRKLLPPPASLAAARGRDCSHTHPLGRLFLTVGLVARSGEDLRGFRFESSGGCHHFCKEPGEWVRAGT